MEVQDKISKINNSIWCKSDWKVLQGYMQALESGDKESIEEYEQFGDSPHKIAFNYKSFKARKRFGYSAVEFDQYGWLRSLKWDEIHEISVFDNANHISVGRGKNNKWAKGVSYSTGNAGGGYFVNEYTDAYNSKKEAFISGIEELINNHIRMKENYIQYGDSCGNYRPKYSERVLKEARKQLKEFRNPSPVQLSLF